MTLAEKLMEKLECKTVFTIPILGGIQIKESVVVTWIVMAVITLICFLLTRNLKVENIGKRQAAAEFIVTKLQGLMDGILGNFGKRYTPFLVTVLLYLGFANIFGIFGFKPPTKDINVTAAVAIMSIVLIEWSGIRKRKVGGWIKSFAEPTPIITPINLMEIVIRPVSLCMRLFGNVLGAYIVMMLIEIALPLPAVIPAIAGLYFDLFDGLIQAYVFVFLTGLFIYEATE